MATFFRSNNLTYLARTETLLSAVLPTHDRPMPTYGQTSVAAAIIIFLLNFPFGQDGINDATVLLLLAYIIPGLARARGTTNSAKEEIL